MQSPSTERTKPLGCSSATCSGTSTVPSSSSSSIASPAWVLPSRRIGTMPERPTGRREPDGYEKSGDGGSSPFRR